MIGNAAPKRLDKDREQCARMMMKGVGAQDIAGRLGMPFTAVQDMMKDPAVTARVRGLLADKLDAPLYDDETLFTPEELNAEVDKLTKPALRALGRVLEDPKASSASIVRAAEIALGWQKVIHNRTKKGDEEGTKMLQPIVFDKRASEALERLAEEFSGEDWLERLEADTMIMPESRV